MFGLKNVLLLPVTSKKYIPIIETWCRYDTFPPIYSQYCISIICRSICINFINLFRGTMLREKVHGYHGAYPELRQIWEEVQTKDNAIDEFNIEQTYWVRYLDGVISLCVVSRARPYYPHICACFCAFCFFYLWKSFYLTTP